MIVVEMNKDIRGKEIKAIGPFTFRQIVWIIVGCLYGVPLFLAMPSELNLTLRGVIALALVGPTWACGWVKMDGQYLEKIAIRFVYKRFLTPRKRKVKRTNYSGLRKQLKRDEKKALLNRLTPRQRKAYLKAEKKGKAIRYSKTNKIFK